MQQYKVNPVKGVDVKYFNFRELYVSPDSSIISGVTDYATGLVDGESVMVSSYHKDIYEEYIKDSSILNVKVTEVEREGVITVVITLPVKTITQTVNLPIYEDSDGRKYTYVNNEQKILRPVDLKGQEDSNYLLSSVTQNYVSYNGNISYFFSGKDTNSSGYLVDGKFYKASRADKTLDIGALLYIEDGQFTVGEYTYKVYFNDGNMPDIRRSKYSPRVMNGTVLGWDKDGNEYTASDNVVYDYEPSKWHRVQKFTIGEVQVPTIEPEEILGGAYYHYVEYNGERYELSNIVNEKTSESGYGVIIDGEYFFAKYNFKINDLETIFNTYHDLYLDNTYLESEYGGDNLIPITSVRRANTYGGRFFYLITKSNDLPFIDGDSLVAESMFAIMAKTIVQEDRLGKKYIIYEGKRYDIHEHLYDTVLIAGQEFKLEYDTPYTAAHTEFPNSDVAFFEIGSDGKARLKNKVYYLKDDNVLYGIHDGYQVITRSGVTINGRDYEVETDKYAAFDTFDEHGNFIDEPSQLVENSIEYVLLDTLAKYELEIMEVEGSSTYICYPKIETDFVGLIEQDFISRQIVSDIVNNKDSFTFRFKKTVFGEKQLNPENSLLESMITNKPISVNDRQLVYDTLKIGRLYSHLLLQFPISSKAANNLMAEDITHNKFLEYIKESSYNSIVDMEKDVYYPMFLESGGECDGSFMPITQVRFNMHFRTRDLDNWKVFDDTTMSGDYSNWFVTDYKYYTEKSNGGKGYQVTAKSLQNASDLLGLMNFTTNEVKNQAKKISRSFLRVSFYSTNDPNTQVLLGTSVIYLDERLLLRKYLSMKETAMLKFCDVEDYEISSADKAWESTSVTTKSEAEGSKELNDDLRLSSRLVVKDKYNTDASAEGFNMYLFKEYSNMGRDTVIYARFEFNHAGIGKTIPLMIPRKDANSSNGGTPLYLHDDNDLKILKDGFAMKDIYQQLHFPIHVKYDSNSNKYVYWIANNLRENTKLGVESDIMEFNLFEIKFKDESFSQ